MSLAFGQSRIAEAGAEKDFYYGVGLDLTWTLTLTLNLIVGCWALTLALTLIDGDWAFDFDLRDFYVVCYDLREVGVGVSRRGTRHAYLELQYLRNWWPHPPSGSCL